MKKKSDLKKAQEKLWELCKQITRKRYAQFDGSYRCFTCGAFVEAPHTGHIITDSTCSTEMSYSLDNLRLQCFACNIHKSGNWQAFYQKLGKEYIDNLIKQNNETKGKKYDILWYKAKIEEYSKTVDN